MTSEANPHSLPFHSLMRVSSNPPRIYLRSARYCTRCPCQRYVSVLGCGFCANFSTPPICLCCGVCMRNKKPFCLMPQANIISIVATKPNVLIRKQDRRVNPGTIPRFQPPAPPCQPHLALPFWKSRQMQRGRIRERRRPK